MLSYGIFYPRINMTTYGIFVCLFYASKIIKFNIKKRKYLVFTLVKFEIIYLIIWKVGIGICCEYIILAD